MTEALRALAEELREFTAMKYAGDCKCGKCQLVPRALVERIYHTLNSSGISAQQTWECMGRKQSLPEPGECNWPDCGCDDHATKVIEALLEQGWGPSPSSTNSRSPAAEGGGE